ncbi:MAG: hypothetical protein E6R07_15030 [Nevskiaceae bacterium]|nr:MAG: hypothetical protein E6R07_15030 [Nevskiaceae bacterium]
MSDTITVSLIGLIGVLLAAFVQWLVARFTVRNEADRLHKQLSTEFDLQQLSEWKTQFRQVLADLLAATDPEANPTPNKKQIIPLVLRAQLMLNPNLTAHGTVNSLINQLALKVNGWHGEPDQTAILRLHGQLLEAAREVMYRPRSDSSEG